MNKLRHNLKELVKIKGITMAHLSRETQIPPQTLNNWIAGQEPRSLSQVKRVADYFELTLDQLCFDMKKYSARGESIEIYSEEINAGIFEVILRKVVAKNDAKD